MNYQRIYDEIIERAKPRGLNKKNLVGYFERHHVIPKCLGGLNEDSNYVLLTAREHYLSHWLLVKIHSEIKVKRLLNYALLCMIQNNPHQCRNKNSRAYQFARETYVALGLSDETKLKISKSNSGKIRSHEAREKTSMKLIGRKRDTLAIKKTADKNRGRKNTSESNNRISASLGNGVMKGSNNPSFGKTGEASNVFGRRWYNDGKGRRLYDFEYNVDLKIWKPGMK